jgi:signal transduction histidine kinase
MRRPWPQSIVGRTVLVLLVALVISNLLGIAVLHRDRENELAAAGGRHVAAQIAAIVKAVAETPAAEREALTRTLRRPDLRVNWSPDRPRVAESDEGWRPGRVRAALRDQLGDLALKEVRVAYADIADMPGFGKGPGFGGAPGLGMGGHERMMWRHMRGMRRGGFLGSRAVLVSLRLEDASWLNFAAPAFRWQPFTSSRLFWPLVLITLVVIGVAVWAVWRATKPLALFAGAAERLGLDVNAPPVSERGPREVRRAARAFNEMQERLKTFVHDRTRMLAAISHDLRTPITRLRLRAEFVEDAEQQRKMLADLDEMEAMIAATLAFARDDASQEDLKPLDLAVLLQSLCDDRADAGDSAVYEGPEHLAFSGRPMALKRAFANLIDNAVKYGAAASVHLTASANSLTVHVRDDGPGIPADQLEKVFEPFHRVEGSRSRETGGTGLGLAVVRSMIRAHGGEVRLANRPTGGLEAEVVLPVL